MAEQPTIELNAAPAKAGAPTSAPSKPQASNFPDPRDKEAFARWLENMEAPDRSNCRA